MLVQTHTSTRAPTYRRLQPSLVYQLLLEGSYNPLTESFDLQHHCGPRFINFQTGSHSRNPRFHKMYAFDILFGFLDKKYSSDMR